MKHGRPNLHAAHLGDGLTVGTRFDHCLPDPCSLRYVFYGLELDGLLKDVEYRASLMCLSAKEDGS